VLQPQQRRNICAASDVNGRFHLVKGSEAKPCP
jgi:hypothetical protein